MSRIRAAITPAALSATLVAVLFVYCGALVVESLAVQVGPYDEGHQLLAGTLVADGWVTHRDFISPYTPLNYYLNAAAFALLGPTAIAARLVSGAYLLALAAGLLGHARFLLRAKPVLAALTALAGAVLIGDALQYIWWNPHALAALTVLCYLAWLRRSGSSRLLLVVSGLLTGLLATTKLNTGVYVAAAVAADLVTESLRSRSWRGLRDAALYGLFAAVPLAVYLLPYGGFAGDVVEQILLMPSRDTGPHRLMRLQSDLVGLQYALIVVFPLIWTALRRVGRSGSRAGVARPMASAAAILSLLAWANAGHERLLPLAAILVAAALLADRILEPDLERGEFVVLLSTAFFSHYFLSRADLVHHATMLPWAALLLPWAVGRSDGWPRVALISMLAVLFLPPLPEGIVSRVPGPTAMRASLQRVASQQFWSRRGDSHALMQGPLPLPPALARTYPDGDEILALRYVWERTGPDDAIYLGGADHARIYIGSHRGYWIADRKPGVRDYFIDVGYTTRRDIQERMATDLERNEVVWLVLHDRQGGDHDFERRSYVGASHLDEVIQRRYGPVARFGRYEVLRRIGAVADP